MTDLKERWLSVLAATARAIDDAARIHGLGADDGRDRKNRLRAERAWVETFDWRTPERLLRAPREIRRNPQWLAESPRKQRPRRQACARPARPHSPALHRRSSSARRLRS